MRGLLGVVVVIPVVIPVLISACGVSAEDAPTPIEESTREHPVVPPSFETVTSPAPTTSSSVPPRLSPTG